MRRLASSLAVAALLVPLAGYAATPAENAAFAKQLRGYVKPVFAKQAPALVLGKLSCTLPLNGTVVRCLAHFSDKAAKANVVYGINATLKESGVIRWTTTTHWCNSTVTGRKLAC